MRAIFYLSFLLILLIPFPILGQDFGCYETPANNTSGDNSIDENTPTRRIMEQETSLDSMKIVQGKDGDYTEYYKTQPWFPAKLKMTGKIVNGKQEGKWQLYMENSSSSYVGNYVDGLKEGEWKGRYVNSYGDTIVYWDGNYIHNKLEGAVKSGSWGNGSPCSQLSYSNGVLNGPATQYSEDGKIEKTTFYKNGNKEGEEIEYAGNGRISKIINYKGGKINGEVIEYGNYSSFKPSQKNWDYNIPQDTSYKPVSIQHYVNDTLSGVSVYSRSWGDNIEIENYAHGAKDGKCTYYSKATGQLVKSVEYKGGAFSGEYSKYYDNGQLAFTVICKNNLPYTSVCAYSQDGKALDYGTLKDGNGTLKCYYANGQLKSAHTYKNQCIYGSFASYYDNGKTREAGQLYGVTDSSGTYQQYLIEDDDFNIYAGRSMRYISGYGFDISEDSSRDSYEFINQDTSHYNNCFHEKKYYPSKKLSSDFYTRNNLLLGTGKYYYENGYPKAIENYKLVKIDGRMKSLKDGLCKYYFESGKIKAEVYFTDDKESGHSKYYDEAGNLMREHYLLGDGTDYNVFNGDTVNRIDNHSRKQGKWISIAKQEDNSANKEHDCNIDPESIQYYKNGEPIGTWLDNGEQFYKDSTVLVWIDSIKAAYLEYGRYRNKGLRLSGYVLNGYKPVGHWKEYNTDGKKSYLEWEGDFNGNGDYFYDTKGRIGEWHHYKKNGKVKETVIYRDGRQISPVPPKKR